MFESALYLAEYGPEMAVVPLFWIGLGLVVVGALLLGLLGPESPAPGPTQVTERGGYIPLVLGKHRVGASILWRGNRSKVDIDTDDIGQSGTGAGLKGSDDDIDGVLEEGMVGLCIGCTSVIQQIYLNGKVSLTQPLDGDFPGNGGSVNYESIDKADGTRLRPYFGSTAGYDVDQQSYQRLLSGMELDTERPPVWPNLTWIHFDKCYLGTTSPRWPTIEADVIVIPQPTDDFTFALNHAQLYLGVGGVNPAYCLWVLLTGESPYGVGISKTQVDKTSLNAIGLTLASEEIWININTGEGRNASEMIQDILGDCGITMSEVQGVLTFSLIRKGDSTTAVNQDSLSPPVEKIEILTTKFNPTCVEFQFKDSAINFQQNTVTIENDGPDAHVGTKKNRKQTLKNVTTLDVAEKISQRRGQEFLSLQQAIEFKLARDARELKPGEKVTISGYGEVRVSKVKYDYDSPEVTVNGYKDPWDINVITDTNPDGGGPTDSRPACVRPTSANVFKGKTSPTAIRVCSDDNGVPDISGGGGDGKPPPPVTGACCEIQPDNTVTCSIKTEKACIAAGGDFTALSPDQDCDDVTCKSPPVTGTCCGKHDGSTVSCEDNFTQEMCDGVTDGEFGGEALCANIECGVTVVKGVCCDPTNQFNPCYAILDDGTQCADGYQLDTSTKDCDGHCCDVSISTHGACCYCDTPGGEVQCVDVQSSSECSQYPSSTFTQGDSCCNVACDPCEEPPDPGGDVSNDLYVRPIILPRLLSSKSDNNSKLAIFRSRFDDEHTTMKGYGRDVQPVREADLVNNWNNTPSLPAGKVIDTSGFSIQPAIPPALSYIFDGPSIQLEDNGHVQDLIDTSGIETKQNNSAWLSGEQGLLCQANMNMFNVRSFSPTDVSARKFQAKGLIANRYGTPSYVDTFSNTSGAIGSFAFPNSGDESSIVVPRKSNGNSLIRASNVVGLSTGENPAFKSQPGIGTEYKDFAQVGISRISDRNGSEYFNKQNKGLPISWATLGNKVSSGQAQSFTGAGSSTALTYPDVSTRGILTCQDSDWTDTSGAVDITVEASLPATDIDQTPTTLSFGTAEQGNGPKMRAIMWVLVVDFYFVPIATWQATYPNAQVGQSVGGANLIYVPVLDKVYDSSTNLAGLGSVTFTAAEINTALANLSNFSVGSGAYDGLMPATPFGESGGGLGGWSTYVQVTCGTDQFDSTTVLIGDGGLDRIPNLAGNTVNTTAYFAQSVLTADDAQAGVKERDISRGWDFYVTVNR